MKSRIEVEESQAAPALTPDLLGQLKRQDMKQAVVERFSIHEKAQAPRTAVRSRER